GGDIEHCEENPEVEKPAAEVARLDQDEHGQSPDHEQRPEVLQASLCEHLTLLPQVPREEENQEDLRELARLELQRADSDPEPRAVDNAADPRSERQQQEHDRAEPEEVP